MTGFEPGPLVSATALPNVPHHCPWRSKLWLDSDVLPFEAMADEFTRSSPMLIPSLSMETSLGTILLILSVHR